MPIHRFRSPPLSPCVSLPDTQSLRGNREDDDRHGGLITPRGHPVPAVKPCTAPRLLKNCLKALQYPLTLPCRMPSYSVSLSFCNPSDRMGSNSSLTIGVLDTRHLPRHQPHILIWSLEITMARAQGLVPSHGWDMP